LYNDKISHVHLDIGDTCADGERENAELLASAKHNGAIEHSSTI
jgi:hypothetical protein